MKKPQPLKTKAKSSGAGGGGGGGAQQLIAGFLVAGKQQEQQLPPPAKRPKQARKQATLDELPGVCKLTTLSPRLEQLRQYAEALAADAGPQGQVDALRALASFASVPASDLQQVPALGKRVRALRSHSDAAVAQLAARVLAKLRSDVEREAAAASTTTMRGTSSSTSGGGGGGSSMGAG